MTLESAYNLLYEGALIVLALLIGAMLIRSIMGPAVTDRVLAINMIGTMVIASIAILSMYLKENYLLDVGLIYTMISFVSVLVLASVYIPFKAGRSGTDEAENVRTQKVRGNKKGAGKKRKRRDDR
ncbi:MAG TPA: sodium:proton antiporter [Lachnospiraceae bacterium]|jgi:multicomponent Na+:H+ antiporter subunit F|nr:sodium:proton antiporter [Lachnospiraceae bacterium]